VKVEKEMPCPNHSAPNFSDLDVCVKVPTLARCPEPAARGSTIGDGGNFCPNGCPCGKIAGAAASIGERGDTMTDKAREARLRRRARREWGRATKSRTDGTWTLVNPQTGVESGGLSLTEAEKLLEGFWNREKRGDLGETFRGIDDELTDL
jgi:hypothetical protein